MLAYLLTLGGVALYVVVRFLRRRKPMKTAQEVLLSALCIVMEIAGLYLLNR